MLIRPGVTASCPCQRLSIYGSRGFDVLCITDHVIRRDDPWLDSAEWRDRGVRSSVYADYRAELERESRRARHLDGWKTLLPCEKDSRSVVAHLRSRRPTYLAQIGVQALPAAA